MKIQDKIVLTVAVLICVALFGWQMCFDRHAHYRNELWNHPKIPIAEPTQ